MVKIERQKRRDFFFLSAEIKIVWKGKEKYVRKKNKKKRRQNISEQVVGIKTEVKQKKMGWN